MRTADEISASLMDARRAMSSLGTRPPGDVAALRLLAKALRREADTAASAGRLERSIPGSMTFEGPAASRFASNAGEVAESLFVAQRSLDDAAQMIERAAHDVATAQRGYDAKRGAVESRVRELIRQLGAASG